MHLPPRLRTSRLLLRPFDQHDGPTVERLAGQHEVADTTLTLPHPYPLGAGAEWIATHADGWARGDRLTLAICLATSDEALIGSIGLHVKQEHQHGEIGYWIGAPWWGAGYATEAAQALLEYGFDTLRLHRIQGRHFIRNGASGRIMQKLRMQREGVHRDAYLRWERFEDVAVYAILRTEWEDQSSQRESPNER